VAEPTNELDLLVGSMFTVRPDEDRGLYDEEREWLSDIQDLLREEGVEVDLLSRPGAEVWEGGIEHFRDLYNLRLLAAYLEQQRDIAGLLARISHDELDEEPDTLLASIWEGEQSTRFANLINHQAEGGYYLPVDFAEPIWVEWDDPDAEAGDDSDEGDEDSVVSFGSSVGLQRELAELEPMLLQAGVKTDSGPLRCLKVLRAAADQSVSNDLPIIVW
jgi:hypothetical protein